MEKLRDKDHEKDGRERGQANEKEACLLELGAPGVTLCPGVAGQLGWKCEISLPDSGGGV